MMKTINILNTRKRTILNHFNKMVVCMQAINDTEEKDLDKQSEINNYVSYRTKDNYVVKGESIILYGEVNLKNKFDLKYLEKYKDKICTPEINQASSIPTSFDYEKETIISDNGVIKHNDTWNYLLWFKYHYCLIGKPKKVIIYSIPAAVVRSNGLNWQNHKSNDKS